VAITKQIDSARRKLAAWEQIVNESTQIPPVNYLNAVLLVKEYIPWSEVAMDKVVSLRPSSELKQMSFNYFRVRANVHTPEILARRFDR
jgi:hypothetical protein